VKATLPVSAMKIASDAGRESNQHAKVISVYVFDIIGTDESGPGVVGDD